MKIVRRKYPDNLADSCKCSSVNRMAAGSRLTRSSHGFFSSFSYFSNILSAVNINILGLYKTFWYTGSAFTKYFNHSKTYRNSYIKGKGGLESGVHNYLKHR